MKTQTQKKITPSPILRLAGAPVLGYGETFRNLRLEMERPQLNLSWSRKGRMIMGTPSSINSGTG